MSLLRSIVHDTRYAFRCMRSNVAFSIVAIVSLALGIGCTIAVFSVMYALVLRPLPVSKPDRLVEVPRSDEVNLHSYPVWKQLQELEDKQDALSGLLAYYAWDERFNLVDKGQSEQVAVLFVSGSYFETLGVPAVTGRTLDPADDKAGQVPVCVIGYGLWQGHYGGTPSAIGSTIQLSGHIFQVVGVAPRSFFGVEVGKKPEVFIPLEMQRAFRNQRWPNGLAMPTLDATNALAIVARLKPGVSIRQTDAWFRVIGAQIYRSLSSDKSSRGTLVARALPAGMSRSDFSEIVLLLILMAAIALVIVCANLGSLLLARAIRRQGEIATRLAMGATRSRLVRQLMTESIALSLVGASLGLVIQRWGGQALLSAISYSGEPTILDLSWDTKLVAFTVGITFLSAMLFGLAPAIRATRLPIYSVMQTSLNIGNNRSRLVNAGLVAVQLALAIALFHSAGLLARTLHFLLAKDLGYEAHGVLVAQVSLETASASPQLQTFEGDQLLRVFRTVPGVVSASWTAYPLKNALPEITIPQSYGPARGARGYPLFVSPNFLETRRTPILAGRDFDETDRKDSMPVAILSDQAAKTFFPRSNPIGLSFFENYEGSNGKTHSVTVVGIAKDINLRAPGFGPLPIFYRPVSQCLACAPMGRYELRFAGPLTALSKRLKIATATVDPGLAMLIHPLTEEVDAGVRQNRATAWIVTLFGLFAGFLAIIGVYGLTSYAAAQRTREIGIRMALGAQRTDVLRMILSETCMISFVGLLLGIFAAYGASQLLRGLLWGVTSSDPLTLLSASGTMLLMAGLGALLPASRAMRVDPIACLKCM